MAARLLKGMRPLLLAYGPGEERSIAAQSGEFCLRYAFLRPPLLSAFNRQTPKTAPTPGPHLGPQGAGTGSLYVSCVLSNA